MQTGPSSIRRLSPALFALLFSLLACDAYGQSAAVRGFVTDAANGQPMQLVSVGLDAVDGEAFHGAITNEDGAYALLGLAPGRYALRASFIGYATYVDTLRLQAGKIRLENIALHPATSTLNEVVVEDERAGGGARVTAGQQTIRPADIELVPTPDLSADLVGYLTTLPGIVTTGDRGGQLFIRGGEPSQNLVLLDGMPVYQPFHLLGFYSAFPADVLRSADLYAGGYGAEYGGRLSSVLDITTRNGNNRRFAGAVSASPFVSSVQLEGPIVPRHASFLVSARQSFLEQGAERIIDTPLPFKFGDALAKLNVEPSPSSRLSITALSTYDRGQLTGNPGAVTRDELRWQNQVIGGRFVSLPRRIPFIGELQFSYSHLNSEQGPPNTPTRSSVVQEVHASAKGTFLRGNFVNTQAGVDISVFSMRNNLGGAFQNTFFDHIAFQEVAVYFQPDFKPAPGLSIRPGVRFPFYRLDAHPHVEPRLRVVWEHGIHQISGAAGLYYQEVVGVNDRRDATSVFTAWTYVPGTGARPADIRAGRVGRALHALLGYRISPRRELDLSVEGFYKKIDNLFVPEWTAYPRLTTRLQPASGRSYGFDARLGYESKRLTVGLNYGYSSTLYSADRVRYQLWYGDETLVYNPPHDRRHQVNALAGITLAGIDFNVHWQFGSGLPFSQARGFDGFILMRGPRVDVSQQGTRRVIYERPYNARLPTFHRLDVSAEHTFTFRRAALTVQASAINVYDRRNIFYMDVFTLQRTDQLPFVPSLGIKVAVR
ncbi:MAG TPA: TonB-dependent receptor [Rhodothermales bacterium]|nr:TonB-dependent receptor [Rhodothermales bacterium]